MIVIQQTNPSQVLLIRCDSRIVWIRGDSAVSLRSLRWKRRNEPDAGVLGSANDD
jgi:hypothetical protein